MKRNCKILHKTSKAYILELNFTIYKFFMFLVMMMMIIRKLSNFFLLLQFTNYCCCYCCISSLWYCCSCTIFLSYFLPFSTNGKYYLKTSIRAQRKSLVMALFQKIKLFSLIRFELKRIFLLLIADADAVQSSFQQIRINLVRCMWCIVEKQTCRRRREKKIVTK